MKKGEGASGFSEDYWEANYSRPSEMDGMGNAKSHAEYIRALFALEQVDISSVVDLGFGLGELFREVLHTFIPYRAHGIEPSTFAFEKVKAMRDLRPVESTRLRLEQLDMVTWCEKSQRPKKPKWFDLGICNSVFQYLTQEELEFILPILSRQVKYLYLTVPTDRELKRQKEELEFFDSYAIRRSRTRYQKLLRPHFTFLSGRVLESRFHFDEESTSFTDLLYRF